MKKTKIDKMLMGSNYYIDNEGHLVAQGKDSDSVIANFVYWISEIITVDDGQDIQKTAVCEGLLKCEIQLPPAKVPFDKLNTTDWYMSSWGIKCIVYPRGGNASQLFFVAQLLSAEVNDRAVFAHLGWQYLDGKYVYLHSTGGIGTDNVEVQIDANLSRYQFPRKPKFEIKAIKSVLTLHQIARNETIVPLIALAFLSPMVELFKLGGRIPNFLVLLYGLTGTRKTSLALIILSFFGEFGTTSPPASFKDTANAVELKSFQTKDSLLLIDDFHPQQSSAESRTMQQIFQKLLRAYGDRIGRARMGSDLKMRKAYPPRGMALVTGEDVPRGHSSAARFLGIEVESNELNLSLLSEFQNDTNSLNKAMAMFIGWLQPQFEEIGAQIGERFPLVRSNYSAKSNHGRTAEAVAYLEIAYETMLLWMVESKALSNNEAEVMLEEARTVFSKLVINQNILSKEQTPIEIFVTNLTEMITRGKVTLTDKDQALGTRSSSTAIGWQSEKYLYLLPEAAYNALAQQLGQRGEVVPVSATALWKQMASAGLLVTEIEGERVRTTIKVALKDSSGIKKRIRVLKIRRSTFEEIITK